MHIFTGHNGEVYAVACSPTDPALVATGSGDDRGFLWKIGQGDWASELLGIVMLCQPVLMIFILIMILAVLVSH
uniref:Angio-associated migratory cell protein-like n=1 Tax=Rhizophora mucronata TaxID=61149 RepID=A0A2P2L7D0_RHIMU